MFNNMKSGASIFPLPLRTCMFALLAVAERRRAVPAGAGLGWATSAVIGTRSASAAARSAGVAATMADDAALWGDPTTLCTLEELRSARAALQSYEDVLRTPLLSCWSVGGARISLKLESLQTTG